MEAKNTNYESVKEADQNKVQEQSEQFKNKIENTLNNDATRQLAEIFNLNKEQIAKLTNEETNELADSNEVNKVESQLAKVFWKYDEMMALNNNSFTVASVMKDYEEYEERVA